MISMSDVSRRGLMLGAAAAGLALEACASTPTAAGPAAAGTATADPRTLTRIAFGSCAKSDKPQPIWDAVLATEPDLFIFLGDNVYLDTRDTTVMDRKYAELAAQPGFQKLKASVPMIAIWDDHDFGENDAGADYPMKEETRKRMLDFFGEPADSIRRTRADGVYTSYVYGPAGQRVQILLPDLRWNRTPILPLDLGGKDYEEWATDLNDAGKPVPGPYARNPDVPATMLGETQWTWLENELAQPADLRIFGSSLQVIADFPGWEGWTVFAQDHQRLMQAIRDKRADHLVCISGDTHYGEFSLLDVNVPYPIWDMTSSGLTEVWPVLPPNARRVGDAYRAENFGLITVDWAAGAVTMQVRGMDGTVQLEQRLRLADLVVA
jgi:alkaline phosphatase D